MIKSGILMGGMNEEDSAQIVNWYVNSGEFVQIGQKLAKLESGEYYMDIESSVSGIICITKNVGDIVQKNEEFYAISTK